MRERSGCRPLMAAWMGALLLLLLASAPAGADAAVGQVVAESGAVVASREGASTRALGRGADVYPGDVIRTGWNGRVQVRFMDGAMLALAARSRFEVTEYRGAAGDGSVVMSLIRGALRTITGAIGGDRGRYRLHTPVATIGVRGTAYQLRYCDERCVAQGGEAGLYGRVDDGAVEVIGPGGRGVFGIGAHFHVTDGAAPRRILAPPQGVLSGEGSVRSAPRKARDGEPRVRGTRLPLAEREAVERGSMPRTIGRRGYESAELSRERVRRRLARDPEPLAVPAPEPAPAPAPAYQRPGTTADETLLAVATAAPDAPAPVSAVTTLYDTRSQGELRVDGGDPVLPLGAILVDARFADWSRMAPVSRETLELGEGTGAFSVHWGRLEGEMGLQDGDDLLEAGSASIVYAHTAAANLTATFPDDWQQRYTGIRGPGGTDLAGNPWGFRRFDLRVGRVKGGAARLDALVLGRTGGDRSLILVESAGDPASGTLAIGAEGGTVSFDGLETSGRTHEAALRGRFVGPDAEALVVRFDVTGDDDITGLHVIEQYPGYRRPGKKADDVLFAGAVIADEGDFRRTDLYPSSEFGEVRLDGDSLAGALFADGVAPRFVDASAMDLVEPGGTTFSREQGDDFTIAWGRLDGTVQSVSGDEVLDAFPGGLAYAYVDGARLTQAAIFENSFVRSYGRPSGPAAVDRQGTLWDVGALGLTVDRPRVDTRLNAFRLEARQGQDTVLLADSENTITGAFDAGGPKVDFAGKASPDGKYRFDLEGKFVGPDADALVIRFDVTGKGREIVGIQVLEGE